MEHHGYNSNMKKRVSFGRTTVFTELKKTLKTRNKVGGMTEDVSNDDQKVNFTMTVSPRTSNDVIPGGRLTYCERFGCNGNSVGELQDAVDILMLKNGEFVVSDLINNNVVVFDGAGEVLSRITADGLKEPWGVADVGQGRLAMCCKRSKCVVIIDKNGCQVLKTFGQWFFKSPRGIAAVSDNCVVVTDDVTNKVSVHDLDTGRIVRYIGEDFSFKSPRYVTVAPNGNIIISDTGNHSIKIFDTNGNLVTEFGKYGDGNGCFKFPHGVCVDQDNHIFVADHFNNRISVFDQDGRFSCHVITAVHGLHHPQGLTLTPDLHLLVTSGDLKATNVLKYKIECIPIRIFQ